MKGRLFLIVTVACAATFFARAQNSGFGIGVIVGEPTGISAKGWVSSLNAIDAGVAWSFRAKGSFHLHADYLWHFPNVIQASERFPLFAGIGGRFAAGKGNGIFGMRAVGGFAWWPRNVPLEVFVEFAPIFDIIPATELSAGGGLGIRYFF